MYINISKTLEVVIDLCLDNLNDDEIVNAKKLGDLYRDVRKELDVIGKFSRDSLDRLDCCTYVEDDNGNAVISFDTKDLYLLEQK